MNVNWFGTCRHYREAISLLAAGRLPESDQAAVHEHLSNCPTCREALARTKAVAQDLATWTASPIDPSAACHFRLRQALRAVENTPSKINSSQAQECQLMWKRLRWGALAAVWASILFLNLEAPKTTVIAARSQPIAPNRILMVLRSKNGELARFMEMPEPPPRPATEPPQSKRRDIRNTIWWG